MEPKILKYSEVQDSFTNGGETYDSGGSQFYHLHFDHFLQLYNIKLFLEFP